MSWRFRKRVKVIPGVYLNFSKRGISTTIGPRESSVNFSADGTYLNKPKQDKNLVNNEDKIGIKDKLECILGQYHDGSIEIKSESIDQLTSSGFDALKMTLVSANIEFQDISQLLVDRTSKKNKIDKKLVKLNGSISKFLFKKKIARLTMMSGELSAEVDELEEQRNLSNVELHIQSDETFCSLFQNVEKACRLITECSTIWDVTTSKDIDRVRNRSFANSEIRRMKVGATVEACDLIVCDGIPLKLQNMNGGDLLFYPGFVIVHEQKLDFAILDYAELTVDFSGVQFVETETVPNDTVVIGHTWAKVNKNGTPDKRFANNYQIPLAKYAQINFSSGTGLQESFLFSNYDYAKLFYQSLHNYASAIKTASNFLNQFK